VTTNLPTPNPKSLTCFMLGLAAIISHSMSDGFVALEMDMLEGHFAPHTLWDDPDEFAELLVSPMQWQKLPLSYYHIRLA
jgi:hypothetical protein